MKVYQKHSLLNIEDEIKRSRKRKTKRITDTFAAGIYETGFELNLEYNDNFYRPEKRTTKLAEEALPFSLEDIEEVDFEVEDFGEPVSIASKKAEKLIADKEEIAEEENEDSIKKPTVKDGKAQEEEPKLKKAEDEVPVLKGKTSAESEETPLKVKEQNFEEEITGLLNRQRQAQMPDETTPETEESVQKEKAKDGHKIFDQMSFSNTYDLGSIEVRKDIDAINKQFSESKSKENEEGLTETDIIKDFSIIDELAKKIRTRKKESSSETVEKKETGTDTRVEKEKAEVSKAEPVDPLNRGRSIVVDDLKGGDLILLTDNQAMNSDLGSKPVCRTTVYRKEGEIIDVKNNNIVSTPINQALENVDYSIVFRLPVNGESYYSKLVENLDQYKGGENLKYVLVKNAEFKFDEDSFCKQLDEDKQQECKEWKGKVNLGTDDNNEFYIPEFILKSFMNLGFELVREMPEFNHASGVEEVKLNIIPGYVGHLKL